VLRNYALACEFPGAEAAISQNSAESTTILADIAVLRAATDEVSRIEACVTSSKTSHPLTLLKGVVTSFADGTGRNTLANVMRRAGNRLLPPHLNSDSVLRAVDGTSCD